MILQQFFEGVESMQSIASSQIFKEKDKKIHTHDNPEYNLIRRRHSGFPRKEDYSR